MNVALFFTEPRLNADGSQATIWTEFGRIPEVSFMGVYYCNVPDEYLDSFKEQVAQKGGKPELKLSHDGKLHYRFHGEHVALAVDQLASPFMYQ